VHLTCEAGEVQCYAEYHARKATNIAQPVQNAVDGPCVLQRIKRNREGLLVENFVGLHIDLAHSGLTSLAHIEIVVGFRLARVEESVLCSETVSLDLKV
jgi:hypothetical protein